MRTRPSATSGFTLLELLVVIAIISIISAVVVTNLNTARAKANDSRVRSELVAVSQAINVYANTESSTTAISTAPQTTVTADGYTTKLQPLTVAGYLPELPQHPLATSANEFYKYASGDPNGDGVFDYVLTGKLATETRQAGGVAQCFILKNGSSFVDDCASARAQLN